mmetsp:Transcript_72480/g.229054  ORF Transcript_72480/g.229054 Transcript_72480/m.229054 type:complete len:592 (+) Transcript_72480:86-1861(+)
MRARVQKARPRTYPGTGGRACGGRLRRSQAAPGSRGGASPALGVQEHCALGALDGDPPDDTVLLQPAPDPQHVQVLFPRGPLQHLDGLSNLELAQGRRALDLQGVLDDRGRANPVVGGPRPERLLPHGHPAYGAVAQRLALGPDNSLESLFLGALEDFHSLVLGKHPHNIGALAGEALLQGRLAKDREELRALLCVDCARVALDGDPARQPVLHGLASNAEDASALLRAGSLEHPQNLAELHLPHHLALLDVLHVSHGDGHGAGVVLAAGLSVHTALTILGGEPTEGAVLAAAHAHPQGVANLVLAGALEDLQNLLLPELPDRGHSSRAEVGLKRHIRDAAQERLGRLLEEGCALVPLHADPARDAVTERLTSDALYPELVVAAGALEDLNDLIDLQHALGLALADLEVGGDSNLLDANVVLLQQPQEAPQAYAASLNVPCKELSLLGGEGQIGQLPYTLAEGLLRDQLLAGFGNIQEQLLYAEVAALHLLTPAGCSLRRRGRGDLRASCLNRSHERCAFLFRGINLDHDLGHGLFGLVEWPTGRPSDSSLVAREAGLHGRHTGGELGREPLAVLQHGDRHGEGLQRRALR